MSRIQSWNEIVDSMDVRLSKWKMKTLSIGERLTLLKSVLGSRSIYHTSIFKVPMKRVPRGGVEQTQLADLLIKVEGVSLVNMNDMWVWSLEGSGDFYVASVRKLIDDKRLPDVSSKARWIKAVPINVNVYAWKVRLDWLPTIINISRRGMDIESHYKGFREAM
nr:RNA-directed DNA polymerase, eukaryota [Tanacetum cinerariifolium]